MILNTVVLSYNSDEGCLSERSFVGNFRFYFGRNCIVFSRGDDNREVYKLSNGKFEQIDSNNINMLSMTELFSSDLTPCTEKLIRQKIIGC